MLAEPGIRLSGKGGEIPKTEQATVVPSFVAGLQEAGVEFVVQSHLERGRGTPGDKGFDESVCLLQAGRGKLHRSLWTKPMVGNFATDRNGGRGRMRITHE